MALLTIKDLVKDYKLGKIITNALRGIDLVIEEGEFLSIAGPSGSGKTTLLNIIGCLDVPTSGKVSLNGTDLADLSKKARAELRKDAIGFVFQSFNLIPVLTAFENVEIPLILLKWDKRKRKEGAEASYYTQKLWVDKESFVPIKAEYYSKSGKLMKDVRILDWKRVSGKNYPTRIRMENKLRQNTWSEFVITDIQLGVSIPSNVFTKGYLER